MKSLLQSFLAIGIVALFLSSCCPKGDPIPPINVEGEWKITVNDWHRKGTTEMRGTDLDAGTITFGPTTDNSGSGDVNYLLGDEQVSYTFTYEASPDRVQIYTGQVTNGCAPMKSSNHGENYFELDGSITSGPIGEMETLVQAMSLEKVVVEPIATTAGEDL